MRLESGPCGGWMTRRAVDVLKVGKIGRGLVLAFAGGLAAAGNAAAGITGVCPDGSIYIVQRAELIPCRDSKRVEPDEVPPLKPEMLPRPYGWEVFHQRNDPNNPYNLVDTGRAVRGGSAPEATAPQGPPVEVAGPTPTPPPVTTAHAPQALPPVSSPPARGMDLALASDEIRDLAAIVAMSQQHAPATLARGGEPGAPELVVRIAESRAFDARLRDAARRAGIGIPGPVVLFTADAERSVPFYANLTFVQGHMAFHPDAARSEEFGVIDGRLGNLEPGAPILGYVVLPEWVVLEEPLDIYWNDHQLTATLRP